jgi:cytoskeletal protein RodZ
MMEMARGAVVRRGGKTVPTLGETFREARTRKKARLNQAAAETRIDVARLEALESDNLDALPDDVYTKGAIRNYALWLGLSPDDMYALYRNERPAAVATRPLSQVTTTTRLTPLTYATISLVVAVLVVVVLFATHVI